MKLNKDETENTESNWLISCDGYYPFCEKCFFEPEWIDVKNNGLPAVCPKCKAKMLNYKKYSK